MAKKKTETQETVDKELETGAAGASVDGADEPAGDEIAKETMTGDLRDVVLDIVRTLPKPWQQLTENEQRSLADDINARCERAVSRCVRTIAADGRKVIAGTLEQVTIKDGIKAVVKMNKHDEQRHSVFDSQGLAVLMVVSDAAEYTGERAPPDIQADQSHLALGDSDDDDTPVADNTRAAAA
ncbi:MAG TPA: hypothetical protein PLX33_10410 [Alphaproteobacteria bacterium]|nr:hypothetical protein [Alphaproteobacteria bacterium]